MTAAQIYILASTAIDPGSLPQVDTSNNGTTIPDILNVAFGIAGALAFLMIVISGLRYVLAAGDPEKISKAKNGIIYSLVGLLIAISAEAIVSFVVNRL